jgi:tetratricopeptide (TPR) repeat protein
VRAGDLEEAEQQQLEALNLARLSVSLSPGAWDARRALADVLGFTGDLWVARGDDAKAREAYEEAVKIAREVHTQDPTAEQGRNTLNIQLIRLAGFEKSRGAEKHQELYEEALEIARQMVKTDNEGRTQQVALALSLAPTGADSEASQVADKILAAQQKPDAELLVDMARVYSQCSAAAGVQEKEAAAYRSKALDCLARAVDQGYRDPVYLTSHPDFAPLKASQPMVDLVARIAPEKN